MNHYFVVSFGNLSGLTFLYVKNDEIKMKRVVGNQTLFIFFCGWLQNEHKCILLNVKC